MQHNGLSELKIKSTEILLGICKEVCLEMGGEETEF